VASTRGHGNRLSERAALGVALGLNASLFAIEFTTGLISGSLGLIADSLDMLADAAVYAISLVAVGTIASRQRRLARASGVVQITLASAGLLEVLRRAVSDSALPDPRTMVAISLLALAANLITLSVLASRKDEGLHLQASWIFTANDTRANLLVISAAVLVWLSQSSWPDLVAGALIFLVVARGGTRILHLTTPGEGHKPSGDPGTAGPTRQSGCPPYI
jgi:Co/Zn/Cd efflux system component